MILRILNGTHIFHQGWVVTTTLCGQSSLNRQASLPVSWVPSKPFRYFSKASSAISMVFLTGPVLGTPTHSGKPRRASNSFTAVSGWSTCSQIKIITCGGWPDPQPPVSKRGPPLRERWLSTFLKLRPNTTSHIVATPNHKIFIAASQP